MDVRSHLTGTSHAAEHRTAPARLVVTILAVALSCGTAVHAAKSDAGNAPAAPAAPAAPVPPVAPAAAPASTPPPCTPSGNYAPICGLQAPEDLTPLPGGSHLLVSQMRGPAHLPDNNIADLDLDSRAVRVLPIVAAQRLEWTDASCTGPDPKHDVHGFDLSRDPQGRLQLLVVNHGSRESIEVFHVVGKDRDRRLEWRGCVVTPADVRLNDVAALPDGGFVATVMGDAKYFGSPAGFDFLISGANTGYLLEWTPDRGFRKLPGSEAAFPNGVVVDPAGRVAYFAAWSGRKVIRYEIETQRVTGQVAVDFMPDNLSWAPDGAVLTAGILAMSDVAHCFDGRDAFCTSPFRAARIDPATMTARTIADGPAGVMGSASVAVQVGDSVYLGAWAGDRILTQPVHGP